MSAASDCCTDLMHEESDNIVKLKWAWETPATAVHPVTRLRYYSWHLVGRRIDHFLFSLLHLLHICLKKAGFGADHEYVARGYMRETKNGKLPRANDVHKLITEHQFQEGGNTFYFIIEHV